MAQDTEHFPLLVAAMMSNQRSSWENGTAAQALLEYTQFIHRNPKQTTLPTLSTDPMVYLYGMVHDAVLRRDSQGRLGTRLNGDDSGSGDGSTWDSACIGPVLWFVIQHLDGDAHGPGEKAEWFIEAFEDMMTYLLEKAPTMNMPKHQLKQSNLPDGCDTSVISHTTDRPQLWIDGVYMGPPFMAAYALWSLQRSQALSIGKIKDKLLEVAHNFNNLVLQSHSSTPRTWQTILNSSLDQTALYFFCLQFPTGLLGHVYDCSMRCLLDQPLPPGIYGRDSWGTGNGWAVGGVLRLYNILHQFFLQISSHEPSLLQEFKEWLALEATKQRFKVVNENLLDALNGILSHHKEAEADGLFHNVIDEPDTFTETNLAQMVSATIYRLLYLYRDDHILADCLPKVDEEWKGKVLKKAECLRNAARRKVDKWGFVRGACSSPRFDRQGTSTEAQAWAVLMEVARADYLQGMDSKSK
ncbi:hypothetical protein FRC19_003835 [Serendipita sp. 401]|nr:hypothetical protein FRC19_003835 [Serendipita sp. 401]KAG9058140.1 hypothetical protein FS842_001324 [Serendipita sp. 407]